MTEQLLAQQLESPSGTGRVEPRITLSYDTDQQLVHDRVIDIGILTGHYALMRGAVSRWVSLVLVAAFALNACGDGTAEPAATESSTSAKPTVESTTLDTNLPETTVVETTGAGESELVIREMSGPEWEQFSTLEDDGMVCPQPNTKAGDAFWDYSGGFDPSEYGRTAGDALHDALTDMNDRYKYQTGGTEDFLPETGWIGLTHQDGNIIYFVYPEASWEFIVTVTGDASKGAWRHQKATVCAPTS